jgi:hypothetical protein
VANISLKIRFAMFETMLKTIRAVFKGGGVYGFNPPPHEILEKIF